MDVVVTVCDNAAGETCPYWPGAPLTLHWPFPDPAAAEGSAAEKLDVFAAVFAQITAKVDGFIGEQRDEQ
jgi:arsenate reductase